MERARREERERAEIRAIEEQPVKEELAKIGAAIIKTFLADGPSNQFEKVELPEDVESENEEWKKPLVEWRDKAIVDSWMENGNFRVGYDNFMKRNPERRAKFLQDVKALVRPTKEWSAAEMESLLPLFKGIVGNAAVQSGKCSLIVDLVNMWLQFSNFFPLFGARFGAPEGSYVLIDRSTETREDNTVPIPAYETGLDQDVAFYDSYRQDHTWSELCRLHKGTVVFCLTLDLWPMEQWRRVMKEGREPIVDSPATHFMGKLPIWKNGIVDNIVGKGETVSRYLSPETIPRLGEILKPLAAEILFSTEATEDF